MYLNFFPKTICKRFEVAVEFAAWQQSNKINKQTFRVRVWFGNVICNVRPDEAPDGVQAKVGEGDHQVDVKVDGYDMPMSIYSQYFSSLL